MIKRPNTGKKNVKASRTPKAKAGFVPTKFLKKFKLNELPDSARELPVTAQMLFEVRDELLFSIRAVSNKVESFDARFEAVDRRFESIDKKFEAIDKRFEAIDKKFEAIDRRFEAIDKRFDEIDKKFEAVDKKFDALRDEMQAGFHKVFLLMEEQGHQNRIVFEGVAAMISRQDRMEKTLNDHIEQCAG